MLVVDRFCGVKRVVETRVFEVIVHALQNVELCPFGLVGRVLSTS